jgi:hypothetical protein
MDNTPACADRGARFDTKAATATAAGQTVPKREEEPSLKSGCIPCTQAFLAEVWPVLRSVGCSCDASDADQGAFGVREVTDNETIR